jgi:hypothetical protein
METSQDCNYKLSCQTITLVMTGSENPFSLCYALCLFQGNLFFSAIVFLKKVEAFSDGGSLLFLTAFSRNPFSLLLTTNIMPYHYICLLFGS